MKNILSIVLLLPCFAQALASENSELIAAIFADLNPKGPGCVVGVHDNDNIPTLHAFGQANLETGHANSVTTIFEAGSVSKQVTAAAVLLLVENEMLSLSDDVRQYLPEIPDYGRPITVAALLNHTSGLRDWGEVQDVAGVFRGEFAFGLNDVLGIAARQKSLNHLPGERWSYTNTGYVLAAILIERISGISLAEYANKHLFEPLKMNSTQWRDDFRLVVPGRAIAYVRENGQYIQAMPFESAYGHGGLLTTVSDLLIWTDAIHQGRLGKFLQRHLTAKTRLTTGQSVDYAMGLNVVEYTGSREFSHAGATAGYLAWAGHYPEHKLSVALLCNDGDVNPVQIAHAVAEIYLPVNPESATPVKASRHSEYLGWYYREKDGSPLQLSESEQGYILANGRQLIQQEQELYLGANVVQLLPDRQLSVRHKGGWDKYLPSVSYFPTEDEMQQLQGEYYSDEANVSYRITMVNKTLKISLQGFPHKEYELSPLYQRAFRFGYSILRYDFTDSDDVSLTISSPRLWALKMSKRTGAALISTTSE